MKVLLLAFFCSCIVVPLGAQQKHALIVAIGHYPKAGGWNEISSIRDVQYIRSALTAQGFADIRTIEDSAATKQGIIRAFQTLIEDMQPMSGDVVYIHFSAHGEQIEDDNGDEPDGLDEAIVPYEALSPLVYKKNSSQYDFKRVQQDYFRDDEFDGLVEQLRKKLGPSGEVVVLIDACHSGTGTRGYARVRGGQPPLVSPGFSPKHQVTDPDEVFAESRSLTAAESNLASYVVISAARAEELNYEIVGDDNVSMGSLSYAVSKVFERLEGGTTYRALFAAIQAIMNLKVPGQHPVLEGNGIDRIVLGGRFVEQKPYFQITRLGEGGITINGGKVAGLDVGATVAVYPAGTVNPAMAQSLTSGTVIESAVYTSQVKLAQSPGSVLPADGWVFVRTPSLKVDPVVLKVETSSKSSALSYSEAEIKKLKEEIKTVNVKLDGVPELLLKKGKTADSLKIASNGYLFRLLPHGNLGQALAQAIPQYLQYKFLQGFSAKDENIHFDVQLVPCSNGRPDVQNIKKKIKGGRYEFAEGDTMFLQVQNKGKLPIYINVLDMQPDGQVNAILPNKAKRMYPGDLRIEAGETRLFDRYRLTIKPPYGTEIFKIFVSTGELDLESIANHNVTRSTVKGLERVLQYAQGIGVRGVDAGASGDEEKEGATQTILFEIKPGK